MSSLPARVRRMRPELIDGLIALVLLVELELEAWLDTVVPGPHRLGAALGSVLLVAPVAVMRRWPGGALVACAVVAGVLQGPPLGDVFNGMTGSILPLLVVAFVAGAHLDARHGLAAAVAAATLLAAGAAWSTTGAPTGFSLGSELISAMGLPLLLWAFGWMWRERSRRVVAFVELASRLKSERERHEQAAVVQERIRIGRELHDIIAQNVSAVIIQAGGARQLVHADPAGASQAILAVEQAGREALADLRRTLGLLRSDDDPRELKPQPCLDQLGSLLDTARGRGVDCHLRTLGDPRGLPAGLDLLGYRVIEAALDACNGDRRPTDVTVRYGRARLAIEIRGHGSVAGLDRQLQGISQRIALYNGTLTVTPLDVKDFAISARLPRR
ncbi:MAG: hypothetical protein JOZ07_05465 [Solirubrobacterales bacterium]|nr:hypothetical protein [Solirubrobacterales bacterium]